MDPTDERLDIVILDWKCFALETAWNRKVRGLTSMACRDACAVVERKSPAPAREAATTRPHGALSCALTSFRWMSAVGWRLAVRRGSSRPQAYPGVANRRGSEQHGLGKAWLPPTGWREGCRLGAVGLAGGNGPTAQSSRQLVRAATSVCVFESVPGARPLWGPRRTRLPPLASAWAGVSGAPYRRSSVIVSAQRGADQGMCVHNDRCVHTPKSRLARPQPPA